MDNNNLWYKNAVFYQVHVRSFCDSNGDGYGDLPGLTQKLDYLQHLGVDCIWLMPIYPSPLRDDGYDISDFKDIMPQYGTRADFKALLDAAHARNIRVVADLVLNHTSDQHPWFQAARAKRSSPHRDYYVWSDIDQKYKDARIIFVDTQASNWTWDEQAGQFFWHRFYPTQPDLNYDNPAVQEEMLSVLAFWLELGIDGFRADAVPYLFEREGTHCENLPETHAFLKRIRAFIDQHYPGRILLCEANQWPEDVRPYFGDGDEFHMGFHFPLMPRLFMALKLGQRQPLEWILGRTPPIPETCQWCTFLRNHDELTLEMVTEEERQWMWQEYAPEARMRLNLGIRRRLAPLLDNDRRKIELAYSLLFTLPGSPIIYYGDEIGMGDNLALFDRNGVRTPMQWDGSPSAGFSNADPLTYWQPLINEAPYDPAHVNVADQMDNPNSLLNLLRRMISLRKANLAFSSGDLTWVDPNCNSVAAYVRNYRQESVLVINNLSDQAQNMRVHLPFGRITPPVDILRGGEVECMQDGSICLNLEPYEYRWIQL
jgi:maltose alpha-D-glucosyltransferase/alpha-amylase